MLAHDQPLKSIADMLGHRKLAPPSACSPRRVDRTLIYTKVDLESLRQAALEWPLEIHP